MKRVALGVAALAAGLTLFSPATSASAATTTVTPAGASPVTASTASTTARWVAFTWKRAMTAGDCRIRPGAKWTLYSNGTARFDARVSSTEGDDAWLMWAHLMDSEGAVLGEIRVDGSSSTKFVKNLPNAYWNYRWQANGRFDPGLFDLVDSIVLSKHC
ncbi:DUF6294 family protein [Nonomuraea sp. 3N208]|uniref:DUF6294 family protein n=1 Tax=Nonomuraea sp. 3N208 TaxID=3457421 RepID=UPI003FD1B120